jgi:hypothetical protein
MNCRERINIHPNICYGKACIKGTRVAAILDIAEFEDWLETKDPKIKDQIRRGYDEYRKGKAVPLDKFLAKIHAKVK